MNIYVLMAVLWAAAAQSSLCPNQITCDITSLIKSCQSSPWVHTSADLLVLTGLVNLNALQPGSCVTIISAGSIHLDNLTLTASDIRIFAGLTYEQYQDKKAYHEPGAYTTESELLIFDNSTVSADGLSPIKVNRTMAYGGSFAANGGSSENPNAQSFYGYGTYFSNPYIESNSAEQYGAAGFWVNSIGKGGGKIILASTGDIKIDGKVTAKGGTFTDKPGNGGSGGYIVIDCGGQFFVSDLGGSVSVYGGDGAQGGFGGSGGRIISNMIVANDRPIGNLFQLGGGRSDKCGMNGEGDNVNECGGAGTLYNPFKGTLQIGQGERGTVKRTPIASDQSAILKSLLIKDKAVGCSESYSPENSDPSALAIEANKITIEGKLRQGYQVKDRILLKGKSLDLIGNTIDGSNVGEIVLNFTQNLLIDSTQKVLLVGQDAILNIEGTLTFTKGSIEAQSGGQPGKRLIIITKDDIILNTDLANISLDKVAFLAGGNVKIKGTVRSTDIGAFCDLHPQKLDDAYFSRNVSSHNGIDNLNKFEVVNNQIFECSQITGKGTKQNLEQIINSGYHFFYNQTQVPALPYWERSVNISRAVLQKNYSIFLAAQQSMEVQNLVTGSVVGLCGGDVSIAESGSVITNGLGCPRDKGAGTIVWNNTCAGAGASYANNGGYGGMVYNIEYLKQQAALKHITLEQEQQIYNELNGKYLCQSRPFIPIKTTPSMPSYFYVGSGGTSSNSTNGGAGGGMILLNALNTCSIQGSVEAQGGDASQSIDNYSLGSGGGSGGSIFVETSVLKGSGDIKLNGGKGSSPGGGGGAGGAFFFLLRDFYNPEKYPENTSQWTRGDPVILGGESGKASNQLAEGGKGSNGFTQSTPCYKGYQLHTCSACPIGTFKDNPSHFECNQCYNLPSHALYSSQAWINSDCPYTCEKDYNLAQNGECLTSIQLFFDRIGGIVFIVVGIIILVLCVVGIILCCRFRMARQKKRALRNRLSAGSPQNLQEKQLADNRVSLIQKATFVRKEFGVQDLPYHECRVYLFGSNGFTLDSGWSLPYQPHPAVRDQINEDSYQTFVTEINEAA